jgi:hypothetical protein
MRLRFDAARLEALEREWDSKLGGPITRPYREVLCYCAGRLFGSGAQLGDLVGYLTLAFDLAVEALEAGSMPAGPEVET